MFRSLQNTSGRMKDTCTQLFTSVVSFISLAAFFKFISIGLATMDIVTDSKLSAEYYHGKNKSSCLEKGTRVHVHEIEKI